jgi:hypothetical protein
MDLIRHADTSTTMPLPNAGVPPNGSPDDKPGWFIDCDLENGVLGTPIMAQWANSIQAEIVNTIIKAGLTPSYGEWEQLGAAVEKMILEAPLATVEQAGRIELATDVEVAAGSDTNRAVTPAGLAGALLAGRGWRANQTWATPGTFSFTVPPGVRQLYIEVWGGGGGAGHIGTDSSLLGGGGGGGGHAKGSYPVTSGQVLSIIVGQGGSLGTAAVDGGNGGTSSVGTLISATGGAGGKRSSGASITGVGGAGGIGAGQINIAGQEGEAGQTNAAGSVGAMGGDAGCGGAGGRSSTGSGDAGKWPGGGGSSKGPSAVNTAGTGASGGVILWW